MTVFISVHLPPQPIHHPGKIPDRKPPDEFVDKEDRISEIEIALQYEDILNDILVKSLNVPPAHPQFLLRLFPRSTLIYPELSVLKCLKGKPSLPQLFNGNVGHPQSPPRRPRNLP